ncbi:hypothetical protein CLV37_11924 [Kineococcus rhizosphaerae]|uniref:Uncharacterized protein n=2 Tax=Kineococcus rhizosphaerae TaxID=559628 RepID=A0A2T0QWU6_9ACTN|nr:hypothetical protein CLV37_11924 [Kineococcus rhizosphaerae]
MAVAALAPLLLLSGTHSHRTAQDGASLTAPATAPPVQRIPADCYLTSSFTYSSIEAGVADLDAAQTDLAVWAKQIDTSLAAHPSLRTSDLPDRARAVLALSQPQAQRTKSVNGAYITAFNAQGQMIARASYGRPGEARWTPTPGHGYLLEDLTFAITPEMGGKSCSTPG